MYSTVTCQLISRRGEEDPTSQCGGSVEATGQKGIWEGNIGVAVGKQAASLLSPVRMSQLTVCRQKYNQPSEWSLTRGKKGGPLCYPSSFLRAVQVYTAQKNTELFCPSHSTSPSGGLLISALGATSTCDYGSGSPLEMDTLSFGFFPSFAVVPWPSDPDVALFGSPVSAVGWKLAAPSGPSVRGCAQQAGAEARVSWLLAPANTSLPFYLIVVLLKPVGSLCWLHQMPPSHIVALGRGPIPRRGLLWERGEENPIS